MYRGRQFLHHPGLPGRTRFLQPLSKRPQPPSILRCYSDKAGSGQPQSSTASRAKRILDRLPPSLGRYTRRLQDAPGSHVVAFLILHEITAIVPVLGLFGLFHYYSDHVPIDYMVDHYGKQVTDGVRRFEKYFRRKGWFGFGAEEAGPGLEGASGPAVVTAGVPADAGSGNSAVMERWKSTDSKYKIVVEVGLAYAITKVLLPVRIVVSLWATPWFAGVLVRLRGKSWPQKRN